nr:helix-turn-helix transcriptional regulator [uncultured Rhodopila sp.]
MTEPQSVRMPVKRHRPGAIDVSIGSRIRSRRLSLGMSLEQLGAGVGVTFQQIAKYESGLNRVGACRLWDISVVLGVTMSFFFEDAPPDVSCDIDGRAARHTGHRPDAPAALAGEATGRRESLDLLEAYHNVADPVMRRNVLNLMRSMCSVRQEA